MKRKTGSIINAAALMYLMLPIVIFAFGWLRIYYACAVAAILCAALFFALKDMTEVDISFDIRQVNIALAVCIIVMLWVGFSGIGGISFQNTDHEIRNAIFRDLVQYPWPVIYHFSSGQSAQALAGHNGVLVYYMAYWLPAALIGKLCGWEAAGLALYLWTVLGVLLSVYYFSVYLRKSISLAAVVFLIFWSGLDVVGTFVRYHNFTLGAHIERWGSYFQYSCNTTTLFWVFNQTIMPWLAVMMLLNQRNNKNTLLLYTLCIPYAPLPCIGLLPFIIYWSFFMPMDSSTGAVRPMQKLTEKIHAVWLRTRAMLTLQNTLVPVVVCILAGSYFMANSYIGSHYHGLIVFIVKSPLKLAGVYILFCILEFGLYAITIFPAFKKDKVFLLALITLILLPLYYAGVNNDFVMRASIPALLIMMAYTARYFYESRDRARKIVLVVLIAIGSITPIDEIYRSFYFTYFYYPYRLADHTQTLSNIEAIGDVGPFVAINPENSFFFKYLGKPIPTK